MNLNFFYAFLPLLLPVLLFGQKPADTDAEYDQAYERRIKQEQLHGVYIPADLGDAFAQLNTLIDREAKQRFMQADEEEAVRRLHFSLGRWIIHNWGFYGGSRLSHYLKGIGLHHPDDMARFIIRSYHRNLNKRNLNAKPQIDSLAQVREQERQQRLLRGQPLYTIPKAAVAKDTID